MRNTNWFATEAAGASILCGMGVTWFSSGAAASPVVEIVQDDPLQIMIDAKGLPERKIEDRTFEVA